MIFLKKSMFFLKKCEVLQRDSPECVVRWSPQTPASEMICSLGIDKGKKDYPSSSRPEWLDSKAA